jgi:hypothetical protein
LYQDATNVDLDVDVDLDLDREFLRPGLFSRVFVLKCFMRGGTDEIQDYVQVQDEVQVEVQVHDHWGF